MLQLYSKFLLLKIDQKISSSNFLLVIFNNAVEFEFYLSIGNL